MKSNYKYIGMLNALLCYGSLANFEHLFIGGPSLAAKQIAKPTLFHSATNILISTKDIET